MQADGPSGGLVVVAAAAAGVIGALVAVVGLAGPSTAQEQSQEPPRLVILARSDVPADALASGPVGGVLGAPVLLTPRDDLHAAAANALDAIDPDMVVLAGGAAALSEQVEQAVADLGYPTRRAAGADRHETAVLISALLAEFNTGRPVLTGTQVTDEVIPGLNAERLQGQTPDDLVAGLTARIDELETELADVKGLLGGVTRETLEGRDTIRFEAVNLQLVDGTGATGGTTNGLGNLIIGYNTHPPTAAERTGSHYLVVGDEHDWTAHGGIVAGFRNAASGDWATVTGGLFSTASGFAASVPGGAGNTAAGTGASTTGGEGGTASGNFSSVTGGSSNAASGTGASVSGGEDNAASGTAGSVTGGRDNTAGGQWASVAGGVDNTAAGSWSSVVGGQLNEAAGSRATVAGGRTNSAAANWSIILGGGGRELIEDQPNECNSQAGSQVFADTCPF